MDIYRQTKSTKKRNSQLFTSGRKRYSGPCHAPRNLPITNFSIKRLNDLHFIYCAYKWTIHDCKQKAKKKRETEIKLCWKEIFAAPKNRHCGIHKIYCNLVCHTSLKWETKYWSMVLILTCYIRVWNESGVIFLFKNLLELHTGECLWHPLKFFNLFPDLC